MAELTRLPEKEGFAHEIVNHLFPDLTDDQRLRVKNLFNHAYDHGWADDDLKNCIIRNICGEHRLVVPKDNREWDDEKVYPGDDTDDEDEE